MLQQNCEEEGIKYLEADLHLTCQIFTPGAIRHLLTFFVESQYILLDADTFLFFSNKYIHSVIIRHCNSFKTVFWIRFLFMFIRIQLQNLIADPDQAFIRESRPL